MTHRLTPGLLAVLGFLAAVAPLASDIFLASFTDVASDLGADASSVQLTLTAFLLGVGLGQLFLGPASDRFGRRRVLVVALSVFAASSIAMVFSPNLPIFIALRFVQGFAGASGVVIARAIAADLSTGTTAVRALSLIATVVGVGPLIAPPIGGVVAEVWGWRGVLAVLAVIATIMFLLALWMVPESLPPGRRHSGGIGNTFARFGRLLADPSFLAFLIAFSAGYAAMMAYIAASPFVAQSVLGMGPLLYSVGFAAGAAALLLSNLANARIAPRVGPSRMLAVGVGLTLAASALLTVLATTGALAPATFVLCAFLLTGGAGFVMSNASALALARAHAARGSGSALLGSTQFLLGALTSPLVGLWGEHTAAPMALIALTWSAAAVLAAIVGLRAGRRSA